MDLNHSQRFITVLGKKRRLWTYTSTKESTMVSTCPLHPGAALGKIRWRLLPSTRWGQEKVSCPSNLCTDTATSSDRGEDSDTSRRWSPTLCSCSKWWCSFSSRWTTSRSNLNSECSRSGGTPVWRNRVEVTFGSSVSCYFLSYYFSPTFYKYSPLHWHNGDTEIEGKGLSRNKPLHFRNSLI